LLLGKPKTLRSANGFDIFMCPIIKIEMPRPESATGRCHEQDGLRRHGRPRAEKYVTGIRPEASMPVVAGY